MEFKKYRKFLVPAVALALIVNANMNRNSSDSLGIDLWGGVRMGMSEKQLRKTLGKSIECKPETEPGYQHIRYCHNPVPIPVAYEKAYINIELHHGKVEILSIGINYREKSCPGIDYFSPSACRRELEIRDRRNFAEITKVLNSKYGKELEVKSSLSSNGKAWIAPNGVQIEILWPYEGSWVLRYSKFDRQKSI